jgi:hypothetical protein
MSKSINLRENTYPVSGGSLTESQRQDVCFMERYASDKRLLVLPWLVNDEERKGNNLKSLGWKKTPYLPLAP